MTQGEPSTMSPLADQRSGSDPELRHARPGTPPPPIPAQQCWAFLVGITEYKHADGKQLRNLEFAASDAEALATQLQLASCGDVAPCRMKLLRDAEATHSRIVAELREFLRGPAPGNLVVLYFACHGMPDPDPQRSNIVYLIAHDTEITKIASTGVRMREILHAIADDLHQPQRALIIADTCYSGAFLVTHTNHRSIDDEAQRAAIVRKFFAEVGQSSQGTWILASTGADGGAREYGDLRHGVFTHYLLEGLRGAADRDGDNKVTIDELFAYVKEKVVSHTRGAQDPVMSTPVPRLILAYLIGLAADEHMALGREILHIALQLDDKDRFLAAASELDMALRAAREIRRPLPEAERLLGIARLMVGERQAAVDQLADAVARDTHAQHPMLRYDLARARIIMGDRNNAVRALEELRAVAPDDLRRLTPQAPETFVDALFAAGTVRRHALLIGVEDYEYMPSVALRGPRNDVGLMRAVLREHCGFQDDDICALLDHEATHTKVLEALDQLARVARSMDVVVVYFSGHATSGDRSDYLSVSDTRSATADTAASGAPWDTSRLDHAVTSRELHDALERIRAASPLVILDTHPNNAFVALARASSSYAVVLAASPEEHTYEYSFDEHGTSMVAGLFTYTLVQRIRREGPYVPRGEFVARLADDVHTRIVSQTPYFVGVAELPLFPPDTSVRALVEFTLRRAYGSFDRDHVQVLYDAAVTCLGDQPFPDLHMSAGRALLAYGAPARARAALEQALAQSPGPGVDLLAPLAIARIATGALDTAVDAGCRLAAVAGAPEVAAELSALHAQITQPTGCALIIGIDDYRGSETKPLDDAVSNARVVRDRLAVLPKFAALAADVRSAGGTRIRMLLNAEASRQAILDGFRWLCSEAGDGPAVFYFAGNGSVQGPDDRPTLISADGRTDGIFDIALDELAQIARGSACYLVSLLDAGFWPGPRDLPEMRFRFAPRDLRPLPVTRDIIRDETEQVSLRDVMATIGAATGFFDPGTKSFAFAGSSARRLQAALPAREATSNKPAWLALWFAPDAPSEISAFLAELSRHHAIEDRMTVLLQRAEHAPIRAAVALLGRLIQKREDPARRVSRGVALGLLGDITSALQDLDRAITQSRDAGLSCFEARYHYGRILVEAKQEPERAVSELKQAVQERPDHAAAHLYLGAAILHMIEQQTREQVKEHWRRYVELGAPLGRSGDIARFLRRSA